MTPAQSAGVISPATSEDDVITYVARQHLGRGWDNGRDGGVITDMAWARELSLWMLQPALQAAALGHTVTSDPDMADSGRWTCLDCRRVALRSGTTIYGEAVRVECPTPLRLPAGVTG